MLALNTCRSCIWRSPWMLRIVDRRPLMETERLLDDLPTKWL